MRATLMVVGKEYRIKHWQGTRGRLLVKADGRAPHQFETPEHRRILVPSVDVLHEWTAVDEAAHHRRVEIVNSIKSVSHRRR